MIVMTQAVNAQVAEDAEFAQFVLNAIKKFNSKNWGDVEPDSIEMNNTDPKSALGIYKNSKENIWIKSDDCGSYCVQTVMYPSEY